MNKFIVFGLALLAVPFVAANGGWQEAVSYLEGKLDSLTADYDSDVASVQSQIDALGARLDTLETPPGAPGIDSPPEETVPDDSGVGDI